MKKGNITLKCAQAPGGENNYKKMKSIFSLSFSSNGNFCTFKLNHTCLSYFLTFHYITRIYKFSVCVHDN